MAQSLDLEPDPFLILLTDALRAGPGSPQWSQAVARLKTEDSPRVDEYKLLCAAREALENGKDYRSVRAGPGFTRKVLSGIDQESSGKKRTIPTANLIAILSALALVIVLALIAYQLWPRGEAEPGAAEDLAHTIFSNELLSTRFEGTIPGSWRVIGGLPLDPAGGLHPSEGAGDANHPGGGLIVAEPIAPDQAFSFETVVNVPDPSVGVVPQVFVSAGAEFSADRATSPRELVWSLQGSQQQVVRNGRVEAHGDLGAHPGAVRVRIVINRDLAVVQVGEGDKWLWARPHLLGSDKPRYAGVRFIRTGNEPTTIRVQSIRIQK